MEGSTDIKRKPKKLYNLILHLHPARVNSDTLRFSLTFGLGGMAALLFVIQVFTGLLLKFHYVPSPSGAYNSVRAINEALLFGRLVHNLHHWSAILFLWITFLHMLRVFFTGAYRESRQATWIFGLLLLVLVVLSNFTGYLLPWDQLSYWAVTVSTSLLQYIPLVGNYFREILLGGSAVDAATLSNFFNLHTGIIPVLITLLMGHHFWRIRKSGGLIVPANAGTRRMVDTQPNLLVREFAVAAILLAILLIASSLFDAPLRERANPGFSPNPAKAPWYFMGLQELLIHFHPLFAIVVFPAALAYLVFRIPYIEPGDNNHGIWFFSEKGRRSAIISAVAAVFFTTLFIALSELLPDPEKALPGLPPIITTGLIPFVLVSGTITFYLVLLRKKLALSMAESIQSLMVIIVSSYSILSLTGILFRGEGMEFMWAF